MVCICKWRGVCVCYLIESIYKLYSLWYILYLYYSANSGFVSCTIAIQKKTIKGFTIAATIQLYILDVAWYIITITEICACKIDYDSFFPTVKMDTVNWIWVCMRTLHNDHHQQTLFIAIIYYDVDTIVLDKYKVVTCALTCLLLALVHWPS